MEKKLKSKSSKVFHKYSGFTLIEIAMVLIIIGSLAVISSKFFFRNFDAQTIDQTFDEIALIHRAALTYYAKNKQWPDQENDCVDAVSVIGSIRGVVIDSGKAVSPWFDDVGRITYETECANTPNPASMSVSLELSDQDKRYLERMLIKIPLSSKRGDATVVVALPAPSSIAALENYLKKIEVTKIGGKTNLNTIEAGFNINGKLVDFEVGSCIGDDKDYSGNCNIGFRTKADAIFSFDPDGTGVLGGLTLIPPDVNLPHGDDFTLNLCDSTNLDWVKNSKYLTSFNNVECVGERKSPAWSIKTNDVYLSAEKEGQYLSEMKPSLRKWIHIKHEKKVKDQETVKRPKCRYISDELGNYGYFEPVIIIRPYYHHKKAISDYISYDYERYDWSHRKQRYKKWKVDIDIDSDYSYLTDDDIYVSVDTYCVTTVLYTEKEDADETD